MPDTTRILTAATPKEIRAASDNARAVAMALQIRAGLVGREVGDLHGVSRERVRQIITPLIAQLPVRDVVCSVDGCDRLAAETIRPPYCQLHYARVHRRGEPGPPGPLPGAPGNPRPARERIWKFIDRRGDDDCWPWTGATHCTHGLPWFDGSGAVRGNVRRWWYVQHHGEVPSGQAVGATCRNRICMNPQHLYAGSFGEVLKYQRGY